MAEFSDELKAKLLRAQSAEEAAELLKADGQAEADAARVWDELTRKREADGRALSPDELEAVSGGYDRNWLTEGCAATVQYGSWCGSNDRCIFFSVTYEHELSQYICPYCKIHMYHDKDIIDADLGVGREWSVSSYKCKKCGHTERH